MSVTIQTRIGYVESEHPSVLLWSYKGNLSDEKLDELPAANLVGMLRDLVIKVVQEQMGSSKCCKQYEPSENANYCSKCGKPVKNEEDYYYNLADEVRYHLAELHCGTHDSIGNDWDSYNESDWMYGQKIQSGWLILVDQFDQYVLSHTMFGDAGENWYGDIEELEVQVL